MNKPYAVDWTNKGRAFGISCNGECILHVVDSVVTMAGIQAVVDALNRDDEAKGGER
jgi:hypothetical protein